MIWINDISKLQYYNQPVGVPCYCETVLQPSHLTLQGILDSNGNGSYTPEIELLTADGLTSLGDVTSFFDIFFAVNQLGKHYFVARLKNFAPAMCANACWILRVTIPNHFDYYTERYCSPECCEYATDVIGESAGFVQGSQNANGTLAVGGTTTLSTSNNATDCGVIYTEIVAFSDCYSIFTGNTYKTPSTTLSGTAFEYREVTHMDINIRELPTTINRVYSLNCRLQRVDKFDIFQLQGGEFYPIWKMKELQNWFTNQYLFVGGERYEMDSTEMFELVIVPNSCIPMYRLNVNLRRCNTKQIFGCGEICAPTQAQAFVMAANPSISGYYSENKTYIGNTCDDAMNYFRSLTGVTSVEALDPEDYDCEFNCAFVVYGLPQAYIDTSLYNGGTKPNDRVFAVSPDTLPYICDTIKPSCEIPVIGDILNEESVCETPVIGEITNEPMPSEEIYLTGYDMWTLVDAGSDATLSQGTVVINIEVDNPNYTYDSGDPDATLPYISEQIGYIGAAGWPSENKLINGGSLPTGATLIIQTNGVLLYSGNVTDADLTGSTIELTNIIYTI